VGCWKQTNVSESPVPDHLLFARCGVYPNCETCCWYTRKLVRTLTLSSPPTTPTVRCFRICLRWFKVVVTFGLTFTFTLALDLAPFPAVRYSLFYKLVFATCAMACCRAAQPYVQKKQFVCIRLSLPSGAEGDRRVGVNVVVIQIVSFYIEVWEFHFKIVSS